MGVKSNFRSSIGKNLTTNIQTPDTKLIYYVDLSKNVIPNSTMGISASLRYDNDIRCLELSASNLYNNLTTINLPLDNFRGKWVNFYCYTKGVNLSTSGSGFVSFVYNTTNSSPTTAGTLSIPTGSYDWTDKYMFSNVRNARNDYVFIPTDTSAASIVISTGLGTGIGRVASMNFTTMYKKPVFVSSASDNPPRPFPIAFRGCNILDDSQEMRDRFKKYNFNLIRFNFDSAYLQDEYKSKESKEDSDYDRWFFKKVEMLDSLLLFAKQNNSKVIIDYHMVQGGMSNTNYLTTYPEKLKRFYDKWEYLAQRYANNECLYAFDPINEPQENYIATRDKPGSMLIQENVIKIIRRYDQNTPICVEFDIRITAAGTQGISYPSTFQVKPFNKEYGKIIYQIHIYAPVPYTTQAYGTSSSNYGVTFTKDDLRTYVQYIRNFQLAYNAHILVGEFGGNRWLPNLGNYCKDFISIFEEYGWDWIVYTFGTPLVFSFNVESQVAPNAPFPYTMSLTERASFILSATSANNVSPFTIAEQSPISPILKLNQYGNNGEIYIEPIQPNCEMSAYNYNYGKINQGINNLTTSSNVILSGLNFGDVISASVQLKNKYGVSNFTSATKQYGNIYLDNLVSSVPHRIYSLRKVMSSYDGSLIRIVRSSDFQELDISATSGGLLDTSAIASFVGSSSATIKTIYDQSGNGLHLTQTFTSAQCQIVSGGILNLLKDKPFFKFNGTTTYYSDVNPSLYTNLLTSSTNIVTVAGQSPISASAGWFFISESGPTSYYLLYGKENGTQTIKVAYKNDASVLSSFNFRNNRFVGTEYVQNSIIIDNDTYNAYTRLVYTGNDIDWGQQWAKVSGPMTMNYFTIGALRRSGVDNYAPFNCHEIILWDSIIPYSEIDIVNKYQQYYYK